MHPESGNKSRKLSITSGCRKFSPCFPLSSFVPQLGFASSQLEIHFRCSILTKVIRRQTAVAAVMFRLLFSHSDCQLHKRRHTFSCHGMHLKQKTSIESESDEDGISSWMRSRRGVRGISRRCALLNYLHMWPFGLVKGPAGVQTCKCEIIPS